MAGAREYVERQIASFARRKRVPLARCGPDEAALTMDGQAAGRLDTTEMPYRFFQDSATGRGSVLYLRYDGHYGLVTAAGNTPTRS